MPLFTTDRTKHYQAVCLGCGTLQDTHPYADNLVEGYICHDVQACMVRQHTQPMIEGGQANAHIILYEASPEAANGQVCRAL